MSPRISRSQRLMVVIAISTAFFVSEISVGFYTHSLALVADAFHYLSDLVSFIVAFLALRVSEADDSPKVLSFGWQRAQLLGAFFNGVLLLGLGISVFLQSIERFISIERVENPKLMFIMGSIGLGLNLISATFLHAQPVAHSHDLGMMGVLVHVLGDAANNLGVMAAALVIWLTHYEGRYYADPGTTMGISIMIILSSFPLMRRAGLILLQSAPNGVDAEDVKHDLEKIPGVLSVHELHIWQLNQQKTLASVHVMVSDSSVPAFLRLTKTINECFHAYGIHSTTIQPEVVHPGAISSLATEGIEKCQVVCGAMCAGLTCCG
ncbi:putative di-, tri-valent inorganic cation transporter [Aspergillus brunneoviolaceus CBS 621.78]|uniref:Cation diffusion facilitator family metal ion transporter n=1 Tax=Aspergillus brunneoviolaceus CBS 621.78 TaxID=1450534 RepID=A0ACD1GPP7_9EURO|nr:cation diffusion facilitator family metal ion transporter [Aspergillus brunneoviolaceus CBS 621.78]RAH51031.1 cation diffusion facilitator family metal ion transporter [Aspergillus brunneoviolaceus CBS 621.78]